VDFLALMIEEEASTDKLYQLMSMHASFVVQEETIKVFILKKKFQLMLRMFQETAAKFQVDYFLMALLNNAFDIAVYFMALHEDEIVSEIRKVLDALVGSIENSNQFMKAKIYLSKQLLPNFTFNAAKRFLKVTAHKASDNSIEKNLFTHSENPIQQICLLYEFLNLLKKKFFSLNNQCSALMATLKILALAYVKEIEDENFLSQLLYAHDYEGRDTLEIVRQIEFLELIQEPKVEAVIQRIYSSDYDVSGHLLSGSTSYKILA